MQYAINTANTKATQSNSRLSIPATTHHTRTLSSLIAIFGITGTATAQTTPEAATTTIAAPAQPAAAEAPGSALSVQLNLDLTTAYFYRGIIQEDSGLIVQPAFRLTANVHEDDDTKLDIFAGTWNSFHGQKTAENTSGDFTEYWYESDLYAGLTLTDGKVSATTSYTFLTSPSNAYETVQELGFTLAYDDSAVLDEWAMKPYATLAIETGADASDGADSDTGVYLELGIGPGFGFDVGETPVTITFPAAVGLSLNDYYQDAAGEDDTFGFAQVGVKAGIPLSLGTSHGVWSMTMGGTVLFLGDHTSTYNNNDDVEVIGTAGIQVNF